MEKNTITEIAKSGEELAQKRSWVIKGFRELAGKINAELAKIPNMNEERIEYVLQAWMHPSSHSERWGRKLTVNLNFGGNAYINITVGKENYDGSYDWEDANMSVERIRLFAGKLPEILNFYLEEIKKKTEKNNIAIDIMAGLISKL